MSLEFTPDNHEGSTVYCHEEALRRLQADLPLLTSLGSLTPWVGEPLVWVPFPEFPISSLFNIRLNDD